MNQANPLESDQITLWRGPTGQAWVAAQAVLDPMFQPFAERLVQAALDAGASTSALTSQATNGA